MNFAKTLVLLLFCAQFLNAAEIIRPDLKLGLDALDYGDVILAKKILKSMQEDTSGIDTNRSISIFLLTAKITAAQENTEQAHLAKMVTDRIGKSVTGVEGALALPTDVSLEVADWWYRSGSYDDSNAVIEGLGQRSENGIRSKCAALRAEIMVEKSLFDEAVVNIDQAVTFAEHAYDFELTKAYRDRIRVRATEIHKLREINLHGIGYVMYVDANTERMRQRYAEALVIYERIRAMWKANTGNREVVVKSLDDAALKSLPIHPVYAAASEYYSAMCQKELGKTQDALKSAMAIVDSGESPYAAEAAMLAGDLYLDFGNDHKAAELAYRKGVSFLLNPDVSITKFAVPQQSMTTTKPPRSRRSVVGWGDVRHSEYTPSQVVNYLTCPWLFDDLMYDFSLKLSFLAFVSNDFSSASSLLDQALLHDPEQKECAEGNALCVYTRLRDDYHERRLYGTSEELAQFTGAQRIPVLFVDLLLECENWPEAISAYQRLLTPGKRWSANQEAYLRFALASCLALSGKTDDAHAILAEFSKRFKQSPTYPRAAIMLAKMEPGMELQAPILNDIITSFPGSRYKLEAILALGQGYYVRGNAKEAKKVFTDLASAGKGTVFEIGARNYLARIEAESP
jgi:tetratricopeptide (TPR) repeat protein